jgi:hypothetical protein
LALAVIGFGLSVAMVREDLSVSQSNKAALVEATDHVALVAIETDSMKVEFDSYKAKIAAYEAKISAYPYLRRILANNNRRQPERCMATG